MKIEKWDKLKYSKKGEGEIKKNAEGVNLTKIFCKHFGKSHNLSPEH
jgi:hypothetical protein